MFKRIDHIEIIPTDLERSVQFYTETFGFTVKARKKVDAPPLEEVVYLELNGTVIEMMAVRDAKPQSTEPWQVGYRMMALEVKDMDKAIEYLKTKGIGPSWGPVDMGTTKRAEIQDPDGISIELRQWS